MGNINISHVKHGLLVLFTLITLLNYIAVLAHIRGLDWVIRVKAVWGWLSGSQDIFYNRNSRSIIIYNRVGIMYNSFTYKSGYLHGIFSAASSCYNVSHVLSWYWVNLFQTDHQCKDTWLLEAYGFNYIIKTVLRL